MDKPARFSRLLSRTLTLILCFLSLGKAWAGIWLYAGERAFGQADYESARKTFQKVSLWKNADPRWHHLTGQTQWRLALQTGERAGLETAYLHFQRLTELLSNYGRGWLYRALVRLAIEEKSSGGVTIDQWKEIQTDLDRAYQSEKGSAWIAYQTGSLLLSYRSYLTPAQREEAFERIKRSVALHHPGQVSPYLKDALAVVWQQFSDFKRLREIVPQDAFSYYALTEFLEARDLWAHRDSIDEELVKLNQAACLEQCRKAEGLLQKGLYRSAFEEFQKAYWIDKTRLRAQAGMLIAGERIHRLLPDFRLLLKEILEDEEQDLDDLNLLLEPVVKQSGDPYLMGLFAFQRRDFKTAVSLLSQIQQDESRPLKRRFLAAGLWGLDEKMKAIETLRPVIDEKEPDLRELFLYKSWNTAERELVIRKVEEVATVTRSAEEWWGWGGDVKGLRHWLDRKGRMGVAVNLKPGKVRFRLTLRSLPDPKGIYAYLLIRLMDGQRERRLGSVYVDQQDSQEIIFETWSSGGKRWLEAELVNGREAGDVKRGPMVEFGTLRIDHSL